MLERAFPFFVLLLLLFTGCGDDYIYEETKLVPNGEWTYEEALAFDFDLKDTSARYDIILYISHTDTYGFQNMYVQFHTNFPSGESESQVVSLELARKNGVWNGRCNGEKCEVEIPLQTNAYFPEPGAHQIKVEQYMRRNPLPGVEGMTLKIRKAKSQVTN